MQEISRTSAGSWVTGRHTGIEAGPLNRRQNENSPQLRLEPNHPPHTSSQLQIEHRTEDTQRSRHNRAHLITAIILSAWFSCASVGRSLGCGRSIVAQLPFCNAQTFVPSTQDSRLITPVKLRGTAQPWIFHLAESVRLTISTNAVLAGGTCGLLTA
jgi:hypothetical protein